MAVFSYISNTEIVGESAALIFDYAEELISAYSDLPIENLPAKGYAKSFVDIESQTVEEEVTYSYNDSSAVYVIDEDFGSIIQNPVVNNDYGSILNSEINSSRFEDYGLITINETLVPYGTIDIGDDSFGQVKLSKIDIGDVSLTILGKAYIFSLPKESGSGTFSFRGASKPVVSLSHIGSGSLFTLSSSTEVVGFKYPESTQLFKITGFSTEKNTEVHVGSGSLHTFVSFTETSIVSESSKGLLFKVTGEATQVRVVFSNVGSSGSGLNYIEVNSKDNEDKVTYSYNESSALYIIDEDFGSITESPVFYDDYESITDTNVLGYRFDDYGLITFNQTLLPYGTIEINNHAVIGITAINTGAGAFRILGEAHIYTTPLQTGSGSFGFHGTATPIVIRLSYFGSGSLFSFSSSAEVVGSNPPESTALFKITGEVNVGIKLNYVGSGSLYGFVSSTESVGSNPPESTALFRIAGTAVPVIRLSHVGSGSLFSFNSATETSVVSESSEGLFKIAGGANVGIKLTYIGSGSLFGFVGATETSGVSESAEVLFKITGKAIPVIRLSHVGSGSLFSFVSATEAVGSNPPESTALFKFSGTATESATPAPHIGSGSLFTFVSATETSAVSEQAQGIFRISGSAEPVHIALSHVGSGSLFAFSSTTEAVGSNPPESTALFRIAGRSDELFVKNNEQATVGSIEVRGESDTVRTRSKLGRVEFNLSGSGSVHILLSHVGSGKLFEFGGSTEAQVANPPEETVLLRISGLADLRSTKKQDASGEIDINGHAVTIFNLSQIGGIDGDVQIDIDGSANESVSPAPYIGSGRLFAITGSTESITIDPEDKTTLFTFSGSAVDKRTNSYAGDVNIDVDGSALIKIKVSHVGTGSLFSFTGATEAVGSNPPESTALFRVLGSSNITRTKSYAGSGSLFSFIGATEATSSVDTTRGLFRISGSVLERALSSYRGSGSLFTFVGATEATSSTETSQGLFKVLGFSDISKTRSYVGSGSLFSFSSTTEATSSTERAQGLFKISGSAVERALESYVGSGSLFTFVSATESTSSSERSRGLFRVLGSSDISRTRDYVGSGSLFSFVSATESTSSVDTARGLFKISGSAIERSIGSHVGSGSLFTFVSTTEAVVFNPTESTALFRVLGSSDTSRTRPYVGSGSLFSFTGATEATSSIETAQGLFKVSGSSVSRVTLSNVSSGTVFITSSAKIAASYNPEESIALIRVSGTVIESATDSYKGSVSFVFFGNITNESTVANPPDQTTEIRLNGRAQINIPIPPVRGSGSLFGFGSSAEVIVVSPDDTKVLFTFSGGAPRITKTDSYRGTGSLFAITGSFEAAVVVPQITTILFNIFGNAFERFGYPNYDGFGLSQMEGLARTSKIEFEPAKPTRIIVI